MPIIPIRVYDFFQFSDPHDFLKDHDSHGDGSVGQTLTVTSLPNYVMKVNDSDSIFSDDNSSGNGYLAETFRIDRNGDGDNSDSNERFSAGERVESEYSFVMRDSLTGYLYEFHVVQIGTGSDPRPAVMISRGWDPVTQTWKTDSPPIGRPLTAIDGSGTIFDSSNLPGVGNDDDFNTNGIYSNRPYGDYWQELDVVCFCAGTLIRTPLGEVAVQNLRPGDLVMTRDHGPQPLRWSGATRVPAVARQAAPKLNPVRIPAGALGDGMPLRDLLVSQQHRVLVKNRIAQRMFDAEEVLVAAKQLVGLNGIEILRSNGTTTYVHLLFDRHEVIWSEGAATESLYPGPEAIKTLSPEALDEIFTLFPSLRSLSEDAGDLTAPKAARFLVRGAPGRRLADRIRRNGIAVFS